LRKFFRKERALILALFPIPYLAAQWLLAAITNIMQSRFNSVGLLWQCLSALRYTLFVLGPLCFIASGGVCIYRAARNLQNGSPVRKNVILILIAVGTIIASAAYFKMYWYE